MLVSAEIPVHGLTFSDVVQMFLDDDETEHILMIGEIGGDEEEKAAELIKKSNTKKKVFGFIAGKTAPKGKTMGHAGAIVSTAGGDAASKIEFLRSCGIIVADSPTENRQKQ